MAEKAFLDELLVGVTACERLLGVRKPTEHARSEEDVFAPQNQADMNPQTERNRIF